MSARQSGVEVRSIDYVPLSERHGQLWHLGPLWFMGNAQIATLAVGVVGVEAGGNLFWSLVAIATGVLTGTFFMAFHSAQGPQLGLPQMIQSRPQFGYVGALLVWLFAYLQYAGFNVFNTILAGQSGSTTIHTGEKLGIVVSTLLAVAVALIGYDFIHRVEQGLTYTFLVIFGVFTIGAIATLGLPSGALDPGKFDIVPFLTQFGVTAGYQISWAIYVSDYSRYLPPDVTVRKTFWWTYWGSGLGAAWLMGLGALLASSAGDAFDTVKSIDAAANGVFGGFGTIVLLFAALGLMSVTALNLYGGSVALFIPWTAVNLIDYYVVRRGHYAVEEIFKPRGLYGRWGWRGILAYGIAFACMIPFFSTPSFTGPIAKAMDGADLPLLIGLP